MKRIYYLLTLLTLAATPLTFTSCDTDDDYYWYDDWRDDNGYNDDTPVDVAMAQTLNGSWTGSLTNEYTDGDGQRVQTQCYVDFSFVQYTAGSNKGNGYETDYIQATDDNGRPIYDSNGNLVYDSQTLKFSWYVDTRTYNIYIEYESGMRYVLDSRGNSDTSGFLLGWDKRQQKDVFSGVMEGVNNDEYVFFDCQRVTQRSAVKGKTGATAPARMSFGKSEGAKRSTGNVPFGLHTR